MLNMPKMIQEWKQVSSIMVLVEWGVREVLILTTERSRPWMEEVAEIINGLIGRRNRERGIAV
jgi:hypothetical protein